MNIVTKLIGLCLMIGIPFPILFANQEHQPWFAALALAFAFVGAGLTMGFGNYRTRPKHIGNFDRNNIKPDINQTWMTFFISAVINLIVANLF